MLTGVPIELYIAISRRDCEVWFLVWVYCISQQKQGWLRKRGNTWLLFKCHQINEVWWENQVAPLEGRQPRASKRPCICSRRFWKYASDWFWLCILISLCRQVPEHTILYLFLIYFGDPVYYTTFLIAYIPTTIDHTRILQGYLTWAVRLWATSFSISKVLVWVSICLSVASGCPQAHCQDSVYHTVF